MEKSAMEEKTAKPAEGGGEDDVFFRFPSCLEGMRRLVEEEPKPKPRPHPLLAEICHRGNWR